MIAGIHSSIIAAAIVAVCSADFASLKYILRSGVGMEYKKAEEIFPKSLLEEMQKYITGGLVYIPNPNGTRKKWGESSGSRAYLSKRNKEIRLRFRNGATIDQLTAAFYLSHDSIKKIVYSKQ